MNTLDKCIADYIEYCEYRKRLDAKTLKAYRIDLKQYKSFCSDSTNGMSRNTVDSFITELLKQYKPKTAKRKIACLKAFFHYMEYKDMIDENPFPKLDIRFREAKLLLEQDVDIRYIQKMLEIIYYDVTNFYFEIGAPDEDVVDGEGNTVEKGLHKMGLSQVFAIPIAVSLILSTVSR